MRYMMKYKAGKTGSAYGCYVAELDYGCWSNELHSVPSETKG